MKGKGESFKILMLCNGHELPSIPFEIKNKIFPLCYTLSHIVVIQHYEADCCHCRCHALITATASRRFQRPPSPFTVLLVYFSPLLVLRLLFFSFCSYPRALCSSRLHNIKGNFGGGGGGDAFL
ncbi:hypothetical protein, unlikely [Trypanosoma brucei gambiense DAL972]|uniref:Uncharacterized protein n=1 Tax=Trypanosoma brucei gambiense (strain MHOM/CI/86/DAL972) TaxID=679716 RepID=C9ZJJ0_TRYB9|nr:hypothetical protein, unlikely [Trypanosoma brucei gambiense DAL972]CBH09549.1 hypothetical protein, unlikely [Trypanosoma brucei gambiense DAL972]|eukprot:XP_011771854.1 hypothetical protein, unlikely [Trypanosoma brucei gambiense DAL972]